MCNSSTYAPQTKRNAGCCGSSTEGALKASSAASRSSSRARWLVPVLSAPAGGVQLSSA